MRTRTRALKALCLLLFAGLLQLPLAHAQTVYRCEGNQYSQSPCTGGAAVDVGDARSREQKAERDAATQRSVASANRLEQERLALEKAARPSPPGRSAATSKPAPASASAKPKKNTKPAPEWFVAATAAKGPESKDSKADTAAPRAGKPSRSEPNPQSEPLAKVSPKG